MSAFQGPASEPNMTLPGLKYAATWPVIKPAGSEMFNRRPSLASTSPDVIRPPMVLIEIPPEACQNNDIHDVSDSTRLVNGSTQPTVFALHSQSVVLNELEQLTTSVPIEAVQFGPHQLQVDAPGEAVDDLQNPAQDAVAEGPRRQRRRTILPWSLRWRSYGYGTTHRRAGFRSYIMLKRSLRDAVRPHVGPYVAVSLRRVARGQLGVSDPAVAMAATRELEDFMTETSMDIVRDEEDHVGNPEDWLVHPRALTHYHNE